MCTTVFWSTKCILKQTGMRKYAPKGYEMDIGGLKNTQVPQYRWQKWQQYLQNLSYYKNIKTLQYVSYSIVRHNVA